LPGSKRGRRLDLVVGITLGIALGIAIIIVFVFFGSEGTIDAPRISGVNTGKPAPRPRPTPLPPSAPIPTVRVLGGAPPPSGPVRLRFRRGEQVRFRILTDAPVGIEIPGYGVDQTVESRALINFRARRAGEFPVIVAASHINVAELRVAR
jgi:hypothetical protein